MGDPDSPKTSTRKKILALEIDTGLTNAQIEGAEIALHVSFPRADTRQGGTITVVLLDARNVRVLASGLA